MKRCPFCAEEIQDTAIVCRFCQRDQPAAPPSEPETDLFVGEAAFADGESDIELEEVEGLSKVRFTDRRFVVTGTAGEGTVAWANVAKIERKGETLVTELRRSQEFRVLVFMNEQQAITAAETAARFCTVLTHAVAPPPPEPAPPPASVVSAEPVSNGTIAAILEMLRTQVCPSQDEVLDTSDAWKVAMLGKGWR